MIDINKIRVASPCGVPWESMTGDERVRKCADCELNVHNLSAMNGAEITKLVAEHKGRLCIRLYRRRDGTVLTQDCPTGVRAYRKRATRFAVAVFSSILGLVSLGFGQSSKGEEPDSVVKIERKKSDTKRSELAGVVMDPAGAVIPGVRVNLSLEGENKGQVSTDAKGEFQLKDLAPSKKYRLEVGSENSPFKQAVLLGLAIAEEERLILAVSLQVQEGSVVVGLFAEEPMIDVTSSTVETKIGLRKLESIPHK